MPQEKQPAKRLLNKYDPFQASSFFVDQTKDTLDQRLSSIKSRLYMRFILGCMLGINAYMSHWGFPNWPSNYWVIVFSIFCYYTGSWIYSWLSVIDSAQGFLIGEYHISSRKKLFILRYDSTEPTLFYIEMVDNDSRAVEKTFQIKYPQYITQNGYFLNHKFVNNLNKWLDSK